MTIEKKLTFAEMTQNVDAQKNNSDLSNLAHALQYLRAGRKALEKYVAEQTKLMDELEAKINEVAAEVESGELVEVGVISSLYNKAQRIGPNL